MQRPSFTNAKKQDVLSGNPCVQQELLLMEKCHRKGLGHVELSSKSSSKGTEFREVKIKTVKTN